MKLRLFVLVGLAVAVSGAAVEWISAGTAVSGRTPGEGAGVVVTDADRRAFLVDYDPASMTNVQIQQVVTLKDQFFAWDGLVVSRMHFTVRPDRVEMLVIPERVWFQGADLSFSVPGGMRFFSGTPLTYNFRMVQDQVFMLMEGRLLNEIELYRKMASALRNPVAFVRGRDPDYLLAQLDEVNDNLELHGANLIVLDQAVAAQGQTDQQLTAQVSVLGGDTGSLQQSLNTAVATATTERGQIRRRLTDQEAAHDRLSESHDRLTVSQQRLADFLSALELAHLDLLGSHQELQANYDDLQARHEELRFDHDALQAEVVELATSGTTLTGEFEALVAAVTDDALRDRVFREQGLVRRRAGSPSRNRPGGGPQDRQSQLDA